MAGIWLVGSSQISESGTPLSVTQLSFDPSCWTLIDDPIWVFDLDYFAIVWANDAALELWKASSLESLQARDLSDSSDVAKALLGEFADGFALGKTYETNWVLYPRKEPVKIRFRCRGVPAADGRIQMLVHVIEIEGRDSRVSGFPDMSAELSEVRAQLASAEARYRTFAEAGSDWLWETDEDQRFVYYSSKVSNHWAYSFDEVLGITRQELIEAVGADPDTEDVRQKWKEHNAILDQHLPFRDLEYAYDNGKGAIAHASVSGDPIFDQKGRFLGYRGIGRDITRRVEAEHYAREMQRERDLAVTANSVTNRFLATMSHELRTPLNAILGFSELMMNQLFGPMGNQKYQGYATDIFDSAHHLLDIVEDLLNVSRLDTAEDNLDLEAMQAGRFTDDIVRMTRSLASGRDLELVGVVPDPRFEFWGDQRGLRQVMFNLISNAIKFTDRGGRIEICCARQSGGFAEIKVRDNGCGISEDDLPFVFDPFHTASHFVARKQGGAGLGLWITKRIVEAHKGYISIQSSANDGTTVTVLLPEWDEPAAEAQAERLA